MPDANEKAIRALRVEIDKNIQETNALKEKLNMYAGRELSLVITKLQEAKMWAGQVLNALEYPYPDALKDEYKKK